MLKKALVLVLAAVMLLSSCSRAGFKASLDRSSSEQSIGDKPTSSDAADNLSPDMLVFDMDVGEMAEDGVYLYYALPRAENSAAEAAAVKISEKIHTMLFGLRNEIVSNRELHSLTVYDALTRNDGIYYSAQYDIKYLQAKDAEKEVYCFGLVFDSASGEPVSLASLMDAGMLTALLLDEQSSKILTKDEALAAKQRAYLNAQGAEALKGRLSYPVGNASLSELLDASFYLDGGRLVAVFLAPQDIGGAIKVSISLK